MKNIIIMNDFSLETKNKKSIKKTYAFDYKAYMILKTETNFNDMTCFLYAYLYKYTAIHKNGENGDYQLCNGGLTWEGQELPLAYTNPAYSQIAPFYVRFKYSEKIKSWNETEFEKKVKSASKEIIKSMNTLVENGYVVKITYDGKKKNNLYLVREADTFKNYGELIQMMISEKNKDIIHLDNLDGLPKKQKTSNDTNIGSYIEITERLDELGIY